MPEKGPNWFLALEAAETTESEELGRELMGVGLGVGCSLAHSLTRAAM